jgi:hypothetical protein
MWGKRVGGYVERIPLSSAASTSGRSVAQNEKKVARAGARTDPRHGTKFLSFLFVTSVKLKTHN